MAVEKKRICNDDGCFGIPGWKLKETSFVFSDRALVHGVTDDDFEQLNIVIAKTDLERIYHAMNDEGEQTDVEDG